MNRIAQHYIRSVSTANVVAAMSGSSHSEPSPDEGVGTIRRWNAAQTDRLNQAHWAKAHGNEINQDIFEDIRALRARASFERANNPLLEGVVNTHADDIVGENGPLLQVQSDDQRYNDRLEEACAEVFADIDVNGQMALPDVMRLFVSQLWDKGEYVAREVTGGQVDSLVSFRLLAVNADRLDSDPRSTGDPLVALGVRRSSQGRPVSYQVNEPTPMGAYVLDGTRYEEFSADEVIHVYKLLEPGQVRGVPWTSSVLQCIADLRDFDVQTLDAARQAADYAVLLTNKHDDAPYLPINDSTTIQRRTISTAPPGWDVNQLAPAHPGPQYVPFRRERLRELGRPVSMPLMKILLGCEDHNFSSARMDNQNYARSLGCIQKSLFVRPLLNRIVRRVERELMLVRRKGQFVLPRRPEKVNYQWTFAKQPHVDPKKERDAEAIGLLETRTLPCAAA